MAGCLGGSTHNPDSRPGYLLGWSVHQLSLVLTTGVALLHRPGEFTPYSDEQGEEWAISAFHVLGVRSHTYNFKPALLCHPGVAQGIKSYVVWISPKLKPSVTQERLSN